MSDIVVGNNVEAAVIEAYWMPGCTSCLRMKEFLEKSGKPWKSINLAEEPTAIDKLKPFGVGAPAVAVGDRVVQGLDLVGIAELIGWDEYDPPVMLTPAELDAKYRIVLDGLIRFTGQLNDETVAYRAQENNRAIRFLVAHAGSIMRYGIDAYDLDAFDNGGSPPRPLADEGNAADLLTYVQETKRLYTAWWDDWGFDDPFDRVLETAWGHRTFHEVFERCVWHTAQHTRQLQEWMQTGLAIEVDQPLTADDFAGLPIPERIMQ
ncbi:MAG: hypothetical protein JWQ64_2462 [Subtercola sp.]|nr:hypothetical protein [Subtercola sp.]